MAWGFVQSNTNNAIGASSLTVTYNSNVQSGNKLISQIIIAPGVLSTITSVQDAALNSETNCGEASGGTGGNTDGAIYAMDVPAGDAGTRPQIKVTYGQTADMRMIVEEFSGLAVGNTTAAMIDGTAAAVEETPVSPQAQPAYTSTALNELLFTFLGDNGNSVSWTLPTGYTADGSNTNGDPNNDLLVAWKNSTNGAESGSWVTSGTPTGSVLIVVAFKLAAAGGPVAPAPQPGAPSWRQRFRLPQAPFPPNPPPLAPPQSPQLPQPGSPVWRQRFRLPQVPQWQPNAPATAPTPAPFTAPRFPARGPAAASAGRLTRASGTQGHPSPFTAPRYPLRGPAAIPLARLTRAAGAQGRPSPFTAPRFPARGAQAAQKGALTSGAPPAPPLAQPPPLPQPGPRSWRQRFKPPQVPFAPTGAAAPSVPAPFFAPHSLLRGSAAAQPGRLTRAAGQPGHPSPFTAPRYPLRPPPQLASAGRLTRATGAPGHPSSFTPPQFPIKGTAAARAGKLSQARGLVTVPPSVPAPFFAPHSPIKGAPARSRSALSSARGLVTVPPPFVPRGQPPQAPDDKPYLKKLLYLLG